MQGIYTYIPETNHVPKEYNVAAVLSLLFMARISLVPAFALMYRVAEKSPYTDHCATIIRFGSLTYTWYVQCPVWQFSVVP
jgi:hypothetical protein